MNPSLLRPFHSVLRAAAAAFLLALFLVLMWGAARDSAYAEEAAPAETTEVVEAAEVIEPAAVEAGEVVEVVEPEAEAAPVEVVVVDEAVVEPAVVEVAVVEPAVVEVAVVEPAVVEPAVAVVVAEPADELAIIEAAAVVANATPVENTPAVTAASHTEPAVHQCNADTFPTSAGWEATCHVTIENTLGSDGATSSRVTTVWCLAEAGVLPPEGCDSDVVTSNSLVTTVNQCNGILAGGSNVTCSVEVINNVPFGTPTTGVTVNQCIGSGQGGVSPGGPPTNCDPEDSSTSGATVTQCNGSANGGGAPERVQCSVTGSATALPFTINQCNGSTAAGSTVTCDVVFTNNFAAAVDTGGTPVVPTPVVSTTSGGDVLTPVALVSQPAASTSSDLTRLPALPATGPATSTVPLVAFAALALLFGALLLAGSKRLA